MMHSVRDTVCRATEMPSSTRCKLATCNFGSAHHLGNRLKVHAKHIVQDKNRTLGRAHVLEDNQESLADSIELDDDFHWIWISRRIFGLPFCELLLKPASPQHVTALVLEDGREPGLAVADDCIFRLGPTQKGLLNRIFSSIGVAKQADGDSD